MLKKNRDAREVLITGLVQGVGFRPFIYNLAKKHGLAGWVENRTDCVLIKIEGDLLKINQFIDEIPTKAPKLASIETLVDKKIEIQNFTDFSILESENNASKITLICPDIAVCDDCLNDIKKQVQRVNYPFANCTNCGPRFSIIKSLPYDRKNTTMNEFIMCPECLKEYRDPRDRRFHAQPNACMLCGPEYTLIYKEKEIKGIDKIIDVLNSLFNKGKIVAIKGIGGFHLACDAEDEDSVKRLRRLKNRDGKPFAVLFPNINVLRNYAYVNAVEEELLLSNKRPIVLLNLKQGLAPAVSNGLNTIGSMLPYTPMHHLIFDQLGTKPLVLTSGNISDEPIVISNKEAKEKLSKVSDALLIYNRKIHNRTDDSVTSVINSKPRIVRLSRGYAPASISLKIDVDAIIATGGELKNSFCIGKGKHAFLSQHIGDLKNIETFEFFEESLSRFKSLFKIRPQLIVHDKHPDYLTTKIALKSGSKTLSVQHHHAHIASCMAEHGLDEEVIGVAFDGTGYGDDGNIWGGEFFVADLVQYKRYTHFDYTPLPGGDKAVLEPWRGAISYLYKAFGPDFYGLDLPFLHDLPEEKVEIVVAAIDKNINAPLTSSAGRLFDTVSALMNVCKFSSFEAEAPMRLEALIDCDVAESYNYVINNVIDVLEIIKGVVLDVGNKTPNNMISIKFHNTIVSIVKDVANMIRKSNNIKIIVFSGGIFQNRYIMERCETLLQEDGFEVYSHSKVPANDGGIALGQLAIAGKKRELLCV